MKEGSDYDPLPPSVSGWSGVVPSPTLLLHFYFYPLHISCSLIISRAQSVASFVCFLTFEAEIRGIRVDKISL